MRLALALALTLAATAQTAARADDAYPSRLVRLVVGFPAGSATDINARILADGLSRKMRQTVIVDNVPGAGGLIALNMVLRSKPDGYTVLVTPPSFAINKIVYKKRGSDPGLWVPVSLVATTPYLLDARPSFSGSTVKDLIAQAKAHPDTITYASGGVGSSAQLAALLISQRAGITMVHVPFSGAAPALENVIAGHVDIVFDALSTTLPYWKSGAVKVLGLAGAARSPLMPSVPTLAESGLPGVDLTTWTAVVAPPKTPPAAARILSQDISDVLKEPQNIAKLSATHQTVVGSTPDQAAKFLAGETALWGKIAKDANISFN